MAVCPFAKKLLIPPGASDPRIEPRVAILHVDAGNAESLHDYFDGPSGGVESHFYVQRDGGLEQYRDTDFQADANLDANDFAVSIETQGFGEGEWTPAQLATIKRLLLWLHREHGIPLRKVQHWNGSGVGYHTLFGAPSRWTPVAKSCPGPDRKVQFDLELVPWMRTALDPPKTPNVTAALRAKTRDARVDALAKVVAHGDAGARAAAREYLDALSALETAEARVSAARRALRKHEEK